MEELMRILYCRAVATEYRAPVLKSYPSLTPGYLDAVDSPIDLGTIYVKVLTDEITLNEFRHSLKQVYNNARAYNSSVPLMMSVANHLDDFTAGLFEELMRLPYYDDGLIDDPDNADSFVRKRFEKRLHRFQTLRHVPINRTELRRIKMIFDDLSDDVPDELQDAIAQAMSIVDQLLARERPPTVDDTTSVAVIFQILVDAALKHGVNTDPSGNNDDDDLSVSANYITLRLAATSVQPVYETQQNGAQLPVNDFLAEHKEFFAQLDDLLGVLLVVLEERFYRGNVISGIWAKAERCVWAQPTRTRENKDRSMWYPGVVLGTGVSNIGDYGLTYREVSQKNMERLPPDLRQELLKIRPKSTLFNPGNKRTSRPSKAHERADVANNTAAASDGGGVDITSAQSHDARANGVLPTSTHENESNATGPELATTSTHENESNATGPELATTSFTNNNTSREDDSFCPSGYMIVEFFGSHDFAWIRADACQPMKIKPYVEPETGAVKSDESHSKSDNPVTTASVATYNAATTTTTAEHPFSMNIEADIDYTADLPATKSMICNSKFVEEAVDSYRTILLERRYMNEYVDPHTGVGDETDLAEPPTLSDLEVSVQLSAETEQLIAQHRLKQEKLASRQIKKSAVAVPANITANSRGFIGDDDSDEEMQPVVDHEGLLWSGNDNETVAGAKRGTSKASSGGAETGDNPAKRGRYDDDDDIDEWAAAADEGGRASTADAAATVTDAAVEAMQESVLQLGDVAADLAVMVDPAMRLTVSHCVVPPRLDDSALTHKRDAIYRTSRVSKWMELTKPLHMEAAVSSKYPIVTRKLPSNLKVDRSSLHYGPKFGQKLKPGPKKGSVRGKAKDDTSAAAGGSNAAANANGQPTASKRKYVFKDGRTNQATTTTSDAVDEAKPTSNAALPQKLMVNLPPHSLAGSANVLESTTSRYFAGEGTVYSRKVAPDSKLFHYEHPTCARRKAVLRMELMLLKDSIAAVHRAAVEREEKKKPCSSDVSKTTAAAGMKKPAVGKDAVKKERNKTGVAKSAKASAGTTGAEPKKRKRSSSGANVHPNAVAAENGGVVDPSAAADSGAPIKKVRARKPKASTAPDAQLPQDTSVAQITREAGDSSNSITPTDQLPATGNIDGAVDDQDEYTDLPPVGVVE